MKAVGYHDYGSLEVLKFAEAEQPPPAAAKAMIRVRLMQIWSAD